MECPLDITFDRMRNDTADLLGLLHEFDTDEFRVVTELAARQFDCKIAIASLIDDSTHRFISALGVEGVGLPRRHSFCAKVRDMDAPMTIEDARQDSRFCDNPFVVGAPHVRFYAGVPLRAGRRPGRPVPPAIGTLCLIDDRPRRFDEASLALLQNLGRVAEALIEARSAAKEIGRLMAESQEAIEALRREQRLFKQAERMANLGSWRLPVEARRPSWSDQVFAIHEVEADEAPDIADALDFYAPKDRGLVEAALARALQTTEPFEFEADLVTAKNNHRRVRCFGELEVANGRPVAIIGVFQDVSHQHELQATLRRHASTDDLTGIANRAECNRAIDAAMARAREAGTKAALLLIDLDGFKAVNDRCGHLAGDDLLRRIGRRLQAPYLARCFVARLGGDEFVVLVTDPEDCADLDALVARLLRDLRDTLPHAAGPLSVSGTIGIGWLDEGIATRSDFLQRADIALYAAKKRRRGTAQTYGSDVALAPAESVAA